MEPDVKITANIDPLRPEVCRLTVDRPVYPDGSAYFPSKEKAADSPLAAKLLEIEGIVAVRLAGNEVAITQTGWEDWQVLAPKAAALVRHHIRSGQPAVFPEFQSRLMPDNELKVKIQEIFDTHINPAVATHGGFVRLIDVKESRVFLEMGGGCQGCGMANVTLRQGIESAILDQLPQVADILDVTDHASGTNPYYAPSKK